jgi:mycofactocin precursor peptide peptidase
VPDVDNTGGRAGPGQLSAMTWEEVAARCPATVLAVPLGSTEQHGPHLPLSTDTDVAVALASRLALARPDIVAAPAVAYGSSGEHAAFPGTLSIGQEALELLLLELGRSADAFAGTVFVSTHGGNAEPVSRAVRRLTYEGRRVRAWQPSGAGQSGLDVHAGYSETSVLMALCPASVRPGRAVAGGMDGPTAAGDLIARLRTGGVASVSPNGVLGDPTGASAEAGRRLVDAWVRDLLASLDGWP